MIDHDYSKKLAEEHWKYVESVMLQQLEVIGKMYRDAMIHGFKHGIEYKIEEFKKNVIKKD